MGLSKNFTVQEELKRQLRSVMVGFRQQAKSVLMMSAGTVPLTQEPLQHTLDCLSGSGNPAPTSSVTRDTLTILQAAGIFLSAAILGQLAPHGSGAHRTDQGGLERPSHALEYEARSQPHTPGPSCSGQDSIPLARRCRLRDRVYAIKIVLGLVPVGQAAAQAGKPGA
ncbi:LOW QUALITY PROTEIN: ATP-binding cassette (ABC) Superfamily [Phytophthora palmivora]|uniref:ATP-binding cassette (ABC) Superfamily n=1 Tax=Phytophthora palmivora TaxID=4796 RepID=A0A2P4YFJ5_9STRA|nr:LOW QUALITY PROTEIN: ATP-binding cassette (ABC) Superfamily [Phytophthora palmivora]